MIELGNASYALYLAHPFAIILVRKIWVSLGLATLFGFWPMVLLSLPIACLLAYAVHQWLEVPIIRILQAHEPGRKMTRPNGSSTLLKAPLGTKP